MDKVKVPRNWRKTRDNFFSHLFHFTSGRFWVSISIILAVAVMTLLGIKGQNAIDNSWLFFVLLAMFIGLPVFFRLRYFREIPKGWTWEQVQGLKNIESQTRKIVDVFSRKYWLAVLCVVGIFVGLGIAFNEMGLVANVPGILTISFFAYVFVIVQRKRCEQPRSEAQERNSMAIFKASYDAKYGKANKSVLKNMAVVAIFVIGFFFFSIGGRLLLNEMQSIILVVGMVSLVTGVVIWRSANKKDLSNNEKIQKDLKKKYGAKVGKKSLWKVKITFGGGSGKGWGFRAPSPLKESDWRDFAQERRYDAKREWESKHWD
ncbi:MAG: hypothetical protein KGI28_00390 [Thaumarchaeota archaeon]|nr:hypothetical protein [Nitrososphaerota archaeon]